MLRITQLSALALALFSLPTIAAPVTWVEGVEVQSLTDRTEFAVQTSAAPVFQSYARANPPVLIVDILEAEGTPGYVPSPGAPFESITLSNHQSKSGKKICRMTFRFTEAVQYDVTAIQKTVLVSVGKNLGNGSDPKKGAGTNLDANVLRDKPRSSALAMGRTRTGQRLSTDANGTRLAQSTDNAAQGSAGASTDDGSAGEYSEKKMTYIGFRDTASQSRVFARLDQDVSYELKKEGDNLMVLEIQESFIPLRNNKNHLDTTFFESPVKMVTPTEVEGFPRKIRIIIEMKENVPYEAKVEGNEIGIYFKK